MRTTLDIDQDVLLAVKQLAASQKTTAGKVLSNLARERLVGVAHSPNSRKTPLATAEPSAAAYGFVPFESSGTLITNQLIDRLRDEEGV